MIATKYLPDRDRPQVKALVKWLTDHVHSIEQKMPILVVFKANRELVKSLLIIVRPLYHIVMFISVHLLHLLDLSPSTHFNTNYFSPQSYSGKKSLCTMTTTRPASGQPTSSVA
jgi:hypothetical protein